MPTAEASPTFRDATREDIAAIVSIHNGSVDEEADMGFGTPRAAQTFADTARLAAAWSDPNHVGSERVMVEVLRGRVVAYVTLEDRGPCLELVNIDVERTHQGRGLGTQLVHAVEARARHEGREAVSLGTSRNAAGVPWSSFPWWRKLGYHVTHEEENDWTRAIGPGTREIRMRKDLAPAERIDLRSVQAGDLAVLFEQQQDPIAVHMAAFTARDPSDRKAFDEHWDRILADPTVRMRTVVYRGRVAGNVGRFLDADFGHPEVTYWIGREFWGRGLATLALRAFLGQEAERPIHARAAADNVASIRVLEKLGFVAIGRDRGFAYGRGQEVDELILRLDGKA
jgi:RimJ/RimL family protein N-acetyltransferase